MPSPNDGDCLTFAELVLATLDRAPAEHYDRMAEYVDIVTLLPEASAPIATFSDFLRAYEYIKIELATYLTTTEYRLLIDNEAYMKNFVFNTYIQCFT